MSISYDIGPNPFDSSGSDPLVWGANYKIVDAADWFANDEAEEAPLWGRGREVVWSPGESLMIVAPTGVGKTTLAGVVTEALLGFRDEVLGYPVRPAKGPILYLAMDRPRQVRRALARRFGKVDPAKLRGRLMVQCGPLMDDLLANPGMLLEIALAVGASVIIVDSVKDVALRLSEDGTGGAYNRARQLVLANGIEMIELHHQKKTGSAGGAPDSINDVYGSTWIGAGAGSVVLLWGAPGDAVVEFRHLKSPSGEIPKFRALIDNDSGDVTVYEQTDPLRELVRVGSLTATALALLVCECDRPLANEIEKARRALRRLVEDGLATVEEATGDAPKGRAQQVFKPSEKAREASPRANHAPSSEGEPTP